MKTFNEIELISSAITACASDRTLSEVDQKQIIRELCNLIVSGVDVKSDKPEWFEGCVLENGFYQPPLALKYLTKWAIKKSILKVQALADSHTFLDTTHPVWNSQNLSALNILHEDMVSGVSPLSIFAFMSLPSDIKELLPKTVNIWLQSKFDLKKAA